ncbi:MAG: iron ABC transporter permease [Leptolyngbyaceae bacterium]|nr:iron ABC transporter permease [Leptolyngbyaceae bacterium]
MSSLSLWFIRRRSRASLQSLQSSAGESIRWLRDPWTIAVMAIALILVTPIVIVLSSIFSDSGDVWQHLASTVLPTYLQNSFWLMMGVTTGVSILGVSTAWLVTACRFPGSRLFEWALLLPLAVPAYLLAYVYTDFLEYYGPVQSTLRQLMGWQTVNDYWFPDVRSMGGAIAMFSLVLYPYVYLLVRVAFFEQSVCAVEASRSLGCGPWKSFLKIALPLARPALAAGVSLALMETLSDFGTVQFFGVDTFTTGIYRTWFGMGEPVGAAKLSSFLLLFIFSLVLLEQWSRRQSRYYQCAHRYQPLNPYQLKKGRAIAAGVICAIPVILGFLLPAGLLLRMAIANATATFTERFLEFARNSLTLALITAGLAIIIALVMAYGMRLKSSLPMGLAVRTASLGYAFPGTVIAVGILIPIGRLDNAIDQWMQSTFDVSTGLLLSGSIIALVFAYLVRFLALSFKTVESSLQRIKPNLDEASRSLGYGPTQTLVKVHAPLMTGGMLTAAILVFVDVMKELPATLIVRPFNFDTLAVQVYRLASDERLAEASAPALAIVAVGIIPVILLSQRIARHEKAS